MDEVTISAATYDEALDTALKQLGVGKADVEIDVLSDGKDGGPVELQVWLRDPQLDAAQDWLLDVLDAMGIACTVGVFFEDDNIVFDVETDEDAGMLIGRKGQTLDALQYLLNVAHGPSLGKRLVVDVQDYRQRHQEKLVEQALEAADRVRSSGRPVRLPPMSPADRRLVHQELAAFEDLETGSQGEEPHRYIVVYPKRGARTGGVARGFQA